MLPIYADFSFWSKEAVKLPASKTFSFAKSSNNKLTCLVIDTFHSIFSTSKDKAQQINNSLFAF